MFILDVLDICKNITFLKIFMYLQILLKLIFIIVPIGLIIIISIDFAKNVLSSDDGGMFDIGGKKMVLSRGLGTHTIKVRVFNPGELDVIDLKVK